MGCSARCFSQGRKQSQIETIAPLPPVALGRIAGAETDRSDEYVVIEDEPTLMAGIWVAAAG